MQEINECLERSDIALVEASDGTLLQADLILPENPKGIVLLVHGNGSSRLSPRNRFVAKVLRDSGLGTLLFDAQTDSERAMAQPTSEPCVDLAEMAERIIRAALLLKTDPHTADLPVGFLGAGTGAAAAFLAAAKRPDLIGSIVARGGRLELVSDWLPLVCSPALLIVGSRDTAVVHQNRLALDLLGSEHKRLEIVPGARHLFEEPGTLSAMAMHAGNWLATHIRSDAPSPTTRAVVHLET